MSKIKRPKPAYSVADNLGFVLGNMWKWSRGATLLAFARSPAVVLMPFLTIYLSKEVVSAVTAGAPAGETLTAIAALSAVTAAVLAADRYLDAILFKFMFLNDFGYQMMIFDKCVESDYELMESADGLTRVSKANDNIGSGARVLPRLLSSVAANIIGIVSYAAILTALSPWITLTVTVTTLAGFAVLRITSLWSYRNKDNWKVYDRKLAYLRKNSGDFTRAKDMRLYSMTDWFGSVFESTLARRMSWHKKEQLAGMGADGLRLVLSLIREGVAYGFLVYLIFARGLTVSDFVLYFGVIGGFANWLNGIVNDLDRLYRLHLGIAELREHLDYPDAANHGAGAPLPGGTFSIEFRNVCYRYAKSTEDTVKNLSFKIEKGEKLAIVGLNGAGKTTLVKLMCGLYNPTGGEILIDGKPINAYNREEYYSLFSAVFQDIMLMPQSIARNVSAATEEETDRRRVSEALALAGLSAKIDGLPRGMDTVLVKSVHSEAVDLSGGEVQKLALARALYKNGKALILDEPTAALDPIAESNIYMEYHRMTAGHTSVFISHRLASTRFCDRIFFIERGEIAESGTHSELMALKGKYCEMYEIQSHYYKEGADGNDVA